MVRFETFEKLGVAVAAISDRSDGDCGLRGPDAREASRRRARCCAQWGVGAEALVCAHQVHGTRVERVFASDGGREPFTATDALVTKVGGLPLAIFVADCVPVYLFDAQRGAGGLVHAGREGTLHDIAGATVAALGERFGTVPGNVHALIGPSAGPCCYEVSSELADVWQGAGLPSQGRRLDLWEANVGRLVAAGVPRGQIAVAGACTICNTRYHSHRRDGDGRRNMALLVL